jgi:hypothetical protein
MKVFSVVHALVVTLALASGLKCQAESTATPPQTLADLLKSKSLSMQLVGDGHDTGHCKLILTDTGTGKVLCSTSLDSLCIGRKTQKPPPTLENAQKINLTYTLGEPAAKTLTRIVTAARSLEAQGKFANVPISPEHRLASITQLAVWQSLSGQAAGSKDTINVDNVKSDLLTQANLDPTTLRKKDREAFDKILNDRAVAICNSVEDTCEFAGVVAAPAKQSDNKPSAAVVAIEAQSDSEFEGTVSFQDSPSGSIFIPAGTTFIPNNDDFQKMMTIKRGYAPCLDSQSNTDGSPH